MSDEQQLPPDGRRDETRSGAAPSAGAADPERYRITDRERPERLVPPSLVLGAIVLVLVAFAAGLLLGDRGLLGGTAALPDATATSEPSSPTPPVGPATGQPSTPIGTAPPSAPLTPGSPAPGSPAAPESPVTTPAGAATAAPTPAPITPPPGPTPTQPPNAPGNFGLFWEALENIRQNFVGRDELSDEALTYGAIRGLVDALGDTGHSVFLTPEALQREQESLSGSFFGIGALLGERGGRPVIVSVISGGPAQRAGLRSGDVLISVDGANVEQLAPEEIVTLVRGEQRTTVVIRVARPDTGEELEFRIVREEIRIPTAAWAMVPGTNVAVLRLIQFSEGAADHLRAARDEAIAAGAQGLILDLRSNPGGFVHEAVRIASLFIEDRTVYIRELADGQRIPVNTCRPADDPSRPDLCRPGDSEPPTDLPLVVLIDQGTASSAEIVSGALRSAGRAELVGETTFGTGTVLLTYELSDGSAVRVAVERWLTPDGQLIFGQGIEPTVVLETGPDDVVVEPDELRQLSPDDVRSIADPQLRRAIEMLTGTASESPAP